MANGFFGRGSTANEDQGHLVAAFGEVILSTKSFK